MCNIREELRVWPTYRGAIDIMYAFDTNNLSGLLNPNQHNIPINDVVTTIKKAMTDWQNMAGNIQFNEGNMDNYNLIYTAERYNGWEYATTECEGNRCSITLKQNARWNTINSNFRYDASYDLYTVILHEIGHVLGLSHIDYSEAVMFQNYNYPKVLTQGDITAFNALYSIA